MVVEWSMEEGGWKRSEAAQWTTADREVVEGAAMRYPVKTMSDA